MRQESFLKSLVTVGAGTVLNLLIGFITTPIITRIAEPSIYGQFSIFTMYTNFVVMVMCMGMDQSLVRFYYKSEEIDYKRRLFGECCLVPLVFTALFIACSLILIYSGILHFEFDGICTLLLASNIVFALLFRFFSLLSRVNYNNKLFASVQVIQKGLYVLLSLFLMITLRIQGLYALSIATVIAAAICVLVYLFKQRRYLLPVTCIFCFDKDEIKSLLKFGYPFIFSMGITSLFQSLDKLALNYYTTYEHVGVYTSAMTFVTLFAVVQSSFNTVWAPKSVEHYENSPEDTSFYDNTFRVITVVMFSIGIALILLKDIFALLLGEKYREAAYIMPFLIFNPIMYTISETTVVGVVFSNKSKLHLIIAGGACLTNFIGNMILVPILGGKGAAISTGISYIVFFFLRTFLSEKYYRIGFNLKSFSIITFVIILYAVYNTFIPFNLLTVVFALICYVILFVCYTRTIRWMLNYSKAKIIPLFIRRK